jgi:pyruvate,water dikinase
MTNPILKPANLPEDAASQLGGKARSLYELSERIRVQVPPWFAISAAAFDAAVDAAGVRAPLRAALSRLGRAGAGRAAVSACRAEIEPLLASIEPDDVTRAAIARAYHGLGGGSVAVRSSAIDEDGAERSFAGCMETALFVHGAEDVVQAVRGCWLSGYSERALAYRAARGAVDGDVSVAVVVQQMIDGAVSGVFFSVDPTSRHGGRGVLTATWGLGEGVVSGRLECDTFLLERGSGGVVERHIADKSHAIVRDARTGSGTVEIEVDAERRHVPALSSEQIDRIGALGWAIERAYGHPVDVEWTWNEDGPWILQARPITTLADGAAPSPPPAGTRKRLWDNSNIVESYSGVTTPLTYSFARHAYSIVYRQALEVLGVRPAEIEENAPIFEQMIGLLNGRVFYSLESWYRLFMLLPGYQLNAEFMEQMMGVTERGAFAPDRAPVSAVRRWAIELPRLVALLIRISGRVARFERSIESFFSNFDAAYAASNSVDFGRLDYDQLVTEYLAAERRLLHRWQTPIINDILAMVFYGTMRKLIAGWIGEDGALQNDLLCGEGGLESTAPTRDLLRMMVDVRKDAAVRELLAQPAADVARAVRSDPRFAWLASRVDAHVDRYGDRCIDELKLETPTLRDDPTFVYASLRAYLAAPPVTVEEMEAREREIRARAEERARVALRRRPDRWKMFRWVVGRARLHVKNRENLRFARTRAFGLVRRFVVQMGDRLWRAGKLVDPRDVFYLQIDELIAFSRGTATTTDLAGLAELRKREYAGHRERPAPPDRLWTTGCVYTDPQLIAQAASATSAGDGPAAAGTVLRGVAASPGVVRARARLVLDPLDVELRGEVLVAHRTDPGWVPLFPSAVAVVVERGSVLSHSAIVAREFGIPCVVGLRDALSRLQDGQEVEVNGDAGTVTVLTEPEGTP